MWRLTSVTLVSILGLGMFGNILDTDWQPAEFVPSAQFAQVEPVQQSPQAPPVAAVSTEAVSVQTATETLDGVLFSPDTPGRHPAVVFVHGAGTQTWHGFEEQAEHLATAGVVSLVLDKRSIEYSTWHRDYAAMAADTLAGVELLRQRPEVDPKRIGLFGESEGTWIAPVAAAQDSAIAFTVLVSAPIVSPAQQGTYATTMAFAGLDVPEPVNHAVAKGIGLAMSLPGLLDYTEFDVLPWLAQMEQPILLVYGTDDPAVPVVQAADLAMRATEAAGNEDVQVRYYPDAQHGIRMGSVDGPFAPGYLDMVTAWVLSASSGGPIAGPAIAGGQPAQTISADEVPPSNWFGSAAAQLAILGFALTGYAAGPVSAGIVRIRYGPQASIGTPARRRRLRWVRALGLASLISLTGYFVGLSHLALNHLTSPLLTYGVWAMVWLVTAAALMTMLSLRVGAWRDPGAELTFTSGYGVREPRMSSVELIATVGTVVGTVLLLLIVSYWGVFLGL